MSILRSRVLRAMPFALTALLSAPFPAGAAQTSAIVEDLGAVDPGSTLSATLWLKPHDEAAFDGAVARQTTLGSAEYHSWMNDRELTAAGPSTDQVKALTGALKVAGFTVSARDDSADALRISGTARAFEAAFGTALHNYRHDGEQFHATVADPRFTGRGADLIAGITGLTNARMQPYLVHQRTPGSNHGVTFNAKTTDPSQVFTDDCFGPKKQIAISHFAIGGATHATLTGPQYLATGLYPAKATCGYTAQQISSHYGLNAAYAAGYQGEGQTIVLVDAYGSPTIQADANIFSRKMGLPALTAANFSVVYPDGQPIANPYPTGWPVEISLDVEWAHAIAPKAKLVLVVAPSDDADELAYALDYAVSHNLGQVISNSYGYPEPGYGPATARAFNSVIRRAAAKGIAVNVSTGDSGDFGVGSPLGAASIPADSPFATGVGGTALNVPSDIGPVESAWGNTMTFIGDINGVPVPPGFEGFRQGGGGGESGYLSKPAWQSQLVGAGRQLPDISAVADPFTGVIIVTPNYDGSETLMEVIGGTSASSPIFSGIWALADQAAGHSLGQAGPIIARMKGNAIRDIMPIQATRANLQGSIGTFKSSQFYSPAALLDLLPGTPNGFVGTAVQITSPNVGIDAVFDLGLGADSSRKAYPGWDNATGFGVPNGLAFIKAAVNAGRPVSQ